MRMKMRKTTMTVPSAVWAALEESVASAAWEG
jgi:hypothetical protein